MIIKEHVDKEKRWLLDDGVHPIQLRVVESQDISDVVHYHKTMYEYFLVLQGEMEIKVRDRIVDLSAGGLIVVEPGESHVILSCSSDAKILLLMPPPVQDDKVSI